MLHTIASSFVIMSCMMHLVCCGIPLLLSITSLATALGLSSGALLEVEWFEAIEQELMIASGVILAVNNAVLFISKKLNCHEDVGCCDKPCDEKKSFSRHLLTMACVLYLINITTWIMA